MTTEQKLKEALRLIAENSHDEGAVNTAQMALDEVEDAECEETPPLASASGSEISDTQRLDWLIKQGPPGACDDGYGLSDSLWEGATEQVDGDGDKKDNTDRKCVRAAIDAAMFPNR
jgi:hypothetical protein